MKRTLLLVLLALVPAVAASQALPNTNGLRVAYSARKNRVNPQGELRLRIDSVDRAVAEAIRLGQLGELRRQIAKGMTLLDGREWTPALDYQSSLVLRSERTVLDGSKPWSVRLEQIYAPAIVLSPSITAKASIRPRPVGRQEDSLPPARELSTFDGLARDLRESPFLVELDLSAVDDGAHQVELEVFDGSTSLATARLGVVIHKGLDARLSALEVAAKSLPEGVRADVLYPVDYIRNVNRGRVAAGTFRLAPELAAAETTAAAVRTGKDPFKGRTGDMERHHVLVGANEVMPYRVYVPTRYNGEPTPLVIALHGLGVTEDSFFDSYERMPVQLAEKHGFLLAAPLGFRVDGFYGSAIMGESDAASKRRIELSEKDVLEVVRLMRAQYKVDTSRVYLIGHSMGAIGAWHLAAKYPDLWAGVAAFAGVGSPATVERMKAIPQFVVHGDADGTVNVSGSRTMVAAMNRLGMRVTYLEVPGGGHNDVVVPYLPTAFEFLASHKRNAITPPR